MQRTRAPPTTAATGTTTSRGLKEEEEEATAAVAMSSQSCPPLAPKAFGAKGMARLTSSRAWEEG
eukprot:766824-Hanusia_phi.AAC.2